MSQDAHDHNHAHTGQRGQYAAAVITLAYAAVEAGVGWWGNSLALLSDGGHMLTDTSTLLIAAFGAWLAQRAPSARHSCGLGRAGFIAALRELLLQRYGIDHVTLQLETTTRVVRFEGH